MTFVVKYPMFNDEVVALDKFFKWQHRPNMLRPDHDVLKQTNGQMIPVLICNNNGTENVVAKGFMDIVLYWNDNGLMLA